MKVSRAKLNDAMIDSFRAGNRGVVFDIPEGRSVEQVEKALLREGFLWGGEYQEFTEWNLRRNISKKSYRNIKSFELKIQRLMDRGPRIECHNTRADIVSRAWYTRKIRLVDYLERFDNFE